jgi:hypothetical protein
MAVRDVTELTVYIKAYQVTMEFFEVGKMLRSIHEHPEKFLTPNA